VAHIVVGTPMYGGMCCSEYVESLLSLKEACVVNGIELTCIFLSNESLIQRGRNTITKYFLDIPNATHLMFIDGDQKFVANDIAKMIKADKGIIGGPVPMKGINWEDVKNGILNNHPDIFRLTGIFNLNLLEGHEMKSPDEPFQVEHIGTGFMLVKREVFEKMKQKVGWYTEEKNLTVAKLNKIYDFFKVQNVNNELLSEDYYFCHSYRELGGEVWAAPWCKLGHFGSYLFSGQYAYQHGVKNGASSNKIPLDRKRRSS
jgi:hypothetical protein